MNTFEIALVFNEGQVYFSVQSTGAYSVPVFFQCLMQATGGSVTSAYLSLLDAPLTEALYHLMLWRDIKEQERAERAKSKLNEWGFPGVTEADFGN